MVLQVLQVQHLLSILSLVAASTFIILGMS